MERTLLETSGNIASVGYDAASQTLEIEFSSGGIYSYAAVPPEIHDKLIHADSPGRYFAVYIRACYDYQHLNPKPKEEANAESGKDSTQEGKDSAAPSATAATAPRKKVKKGRG